MKQIARKVTTRRPHSRRHVRPEDLRALCIPSDPQISPDGNRVVFCHRTVGERNRYATNLWMVAAAGGEPHALTAGGKDTHPRWSPDGHRIAFLRTTEEGGQQIWTIAVGEARALTSFPEGVISSFAWSPTGGALAVSFREQHPERTKAARRTREEQGASDPPWIIDEWWYRLDGDGVFGGQRHCLYLVDAGTGSHRLLFDRDRLGAMSYSFSPDGKRLAVTANTDRQALVRPERTGIFVVDTRSRRARRLPGLPGGPKSAVRWSPDGKLLAYAGRIGTDGLYSTENLELWVCPAAGGTARSLTGDTDYCLLAATLSDTADAAFEPSLAWSQDSRRIFAAIGWHGSQHVAAIPANGGRPRFLTEGECYHAMGNVSGNGQSMPLIVANPLTPPEVGLLALKPSRVGRKSGGKHLTRLNAPLMKHLQLSRPSQHWVVAADGTRVHTWVLRPPGTPPTRRTPAVLQIHGGPHAQYGHVFFHEMQVLAAAGYTVFYANPRGSKGYGRDHCAAIRGSWGEKDWEDVQAVLAFMRGRPGVNPARIGVMGGSYGGYMTNWVIGHTSELRAAISDRCVSNLVSFYGNSDFPFFPDRYWNGNAWDRPESLWEHSPLKFLGNCKTPTLIIHSEGDLRCNIEQSEQVFTVLKTLGVPTRFVRYPKSTSHGMSRSGPPDLRLHRLGQILEWWERWLRG